jgi:iron complex outermembrane receptor protein
MTVFLEGRNLTDDEQRNHVSFLKDVAPLPGRSLIAGLRLEF